MKKTTWKLDGCKCEVDANQYHKMCAVHQAEYDETHKRWTEEKRGLSKDDTQKILGSENPIPIKLPTNLLEMRGVSTIKV